MDCSLLGYVSIYDIRFKRQSFQVNNDNILLENNITDLQLCLIFPFHG